jgi:hypothetical protein
LTVQIERGLEAMKTVKPNKYNARKTVVDGITFDSGKEARRYSELKLLERAGEIHGLKLQPKFEFVANGRPLLTRSEGYPNGRRVKFTPDFQYFRKGFGIVVEDVKSAATKTTAYKLRKAIFENLYYPAKVEEV